MRIVEMMVCGACSYSITWVREMMSLVLIRVASPHFCKISHYKVIGSRVSPWAPASGSAAIHWSRFARMLGHRYIVLLRGRSQRQNGGPLALHFLM